jgi:hypothetical protein
VPLLPIEEQRVRGQLFRRLEALESAARRAAEAGVEVARAMTDGLADGGLLPRMPSENTSCGE